MKHIAAAIVVIAGMVGIYFNVEYSGWVICFGILALM